MTKRRLLFISNLFPDKAEPYRGLDNATVLHHLSAEFDIRCISPRPTLWGGKRREPRDIDAKFQPAYLSAAYVPKFGSRFNHRLMASALRAPLQMLRANWTPDVILSSWIFPDSCAVAMLAGATPFVSIAQGSDVHQYLLSPIRRKIIVEAMWRAAGVITRSARLAGLLCEAGVAKEKLRPVYNGIDFETFAPASKAEACQALGLPGGAPIVLFVGNFVAIKNVGVLLEAHAKLSGVRLALVGGGPLESELRQRAAALGTASRVTFAGRRSAQEVARFMQAASALALPSQNEGVPNVILEAFASGLPVVASRVGGIPEVHNRAGLGALVPAGDAQALADALLRVIQNPQPPGEIREHALQFSWESAAAAYSSILRSACR